jgi:putative membrane protein
MFSLFIGLTLGGVPLLSRMMRGVTPAAVLGVIAGILIMLGAVAAEHSGAGSTDDASGPGPIRLVIGGMAAGGAMILPGVSGSYLLILLGLYLPILEAVSSVRAALSDRDVPAILSAVAVIVPVGIGVVLSIAGISHLLRFLLRRFERVTLGVLLGLLLGAVFGLWPFRAPVQPEVGETVRGVPIMTTQQINEVPMRHWRLERFSPSAGQAIGSILLVGVGFGLSAAVGRIGASRND